MNALDETGPPLDLLIKVAPPRRSDISCSIRALWPRMATSIDLYSPRWIILEVARPPRWSQIKIMSRWSGVLAITGSAAEAARAAADREPLWRWSAGDEASPWYGSRAAAEHSLARDCSSPATAEFQRGVVVCRRAIFWASTQISGSL
jgi:hypothetical protein